MFFHNSPAALDLLSNPGRLNEQNDYFSLFELKNSCVYKDSLKCTHMENVTLFGFYIKVIFKVREIVKFETNLDKSRLT